MWIIIFNFEYYLEMWSTARIRNILEMCSLNCILPGVIEPVSALVIRFCCCCCFLHGTYLYWNKSGGTESIILPNSKRCRWLMLYSFLCRVKQIIFYFALLRMLIILSIIFSCEELNITFLCKESFIMHSVLPMFS